MTHKTTHSVYALYYHIILTVKYRKKLIQKYDSDLKSIITNIAVSKNFQIEKMESDQDHIHILVSAKPNISPYSIVTSIKQVTTYGLWQKYSNELKKEFWKEHVFWTKSYFVNSIGSVSKDAIIRYIANQGSSSAALKDNGLAA
jgi:putative transposase